MAALAQSGGERKRLEDCSSTPQAATSARLLVCAKSGSLAETAAWVTKREPSPMRSNLSPGSEQVGQFAISRWEPSGEFDDAR